MQREDSLHLASSYLTNVSVDELYLEIESPAVKHKRLIMLTHYKNFDN